MTIDLRVELKKNLENLHLQLVWVVETIKN